MDFTFFNIYMYGVFTYLAIMLLMFPIPKDKNMITLIFSMSLLSWLVVICTIYVILFGDFDDFDDFNGFNMT